MEKCVNKLDIKSRCTHDRASNLSSDSEDTSDCEMSVHFCERIFKKRRILNFSSESESEEEEDTEDMTEATPKQKRNANKFSWTQGNFQPIIHEFNDANSGIKVNVNRQSSILDIFQIFFSKEVIEYIVEQSNNHYKNGIGDNDTFDVHNCNETTVPEMYTFLGVTMLMARIHKISLSEYWTKDKLTRTESFGEIMSRDRYTLLLKILHFCDNNIEDDDSLMKIHHILVKLKTSFKTAFYPYEKLFIADSLLLFKERCYFKQYIPSQRSRVGVKSFVLCDSKTGYILDLNVYSEASMKTENILEKSIGKSGMIVVTLLEPYLRKGHTLVTDNWYSSPNLFLELHKNLTNAYGMVRKNRLDVPDLNKKLDKGEYIFRSTKNLLALKWVDKREVWMISTYHYPNVIETNNYLTKEKIIKPQCIIDYDKTMRTVDKADQILYTLNSTSKTLKWYKEFFFHLLDLAVYNTFILYNYVTGENLSFSKFHLCLIKQILKKHSSSKIYVCKSKGKNTDNEPFRLTQRHFPSKYVNNSTIRKNARRKCVVCTKHNKRRETHYECKKCDVGLCIDPCFELYHTLLDY